MCPLLGRILGQMNAHYLARTQYKALVDYLVIKVQLRDWHGVSDAANDIRELVAKYPELEK